MISDWYSKEQQHDRDIPVYNTCNFQVLYMAQGPFAKNHFIQDWDFCIGDDVMGCDIMWIIIDIWEEDCYLIFSMAKDTLLPCPEHW
jgi:hypothetical protein